MHTLTLKDLTFVADSGGIGVLVGASAGKRVALSGHEAGQLEDFLRRHVPRERRVGFRVPLSPLPDRVRAALLVQLSAGADTVSARAIDLSLTGILLEAQGLRLHRGGDVVVQLGFEGTVCRLNGIVVRLDGDLVAVHFVDALKRGELAPPEPLLTVYRALETEWLRNRRGAGPARGRAMT